MATKSTSFNNTPQALDDSYGWTEDQLLASASLLNNVLTLYVMANDRGGNAKTLFSLDDANSNAARPTGDALVDGVSQWELTSQDNWIRIHDGKVELKLDGSLAALGATDVNSLSASDQVHDAFTYAIRLGDGTLSWAHVSIDISGQNDAVTSMTGNLSGTVTEDGDSDSNPLTTQTATGTITVVDPDPGQSGTQAGSGASGLGSWSVDTGGHWSYVVNNAAIQHMSALDSTTDSFSVTCTDGTASRLVTVAIHGANDAPLVSGPVTGDANEDGPAVTLSALANATAVDDGAVLSVVDIPGALPAGVTYDSLTKSFTLDPSNAAYQALGSGDTMVVTVNYGVSDGIDVTPGSASWTLHGADDASAVAWHWTVDHESLVSRVSTDAAGDEANSYSFAYGRPSISADGRYVTFYSGADNLVPGDANGFADIFVKDAQTGTIVRASTDASGGDANSTSYGSSISADGRYVAFYTDAGNLAPGDTNGTFDIFVKDLQTGAIVRASTDAGGGEANDQSLQPSISADGRYVAFYSYADTLAVGDTNGAADIFVKDLQAGAIVRVSTDAGGGEANSDSLVPWISADGRYVAFESSADNLVPGDTNGQADIFVKDLQTGAIVRASTDASGGEANGSSSDPSISADGRYVAFSSNAHNLVAGDAGSTTNVFVKDLQTGTITRLSEGQGGTEPDGSSNTPFISADGHLVAFNSDAGNLVAGDTNFNNDIFLANVANAGTVGLRVTSPALPSDITIDWGDTTTSSQSAVAAGTDVDFRHHYAAGLDTTLTVTATFAGGSDTASINVETAPDSSGATMADGPGGNLLIGNAGPDVLSGGPGDDRLMGGAGNDTLIASGGTDVMTGEDGNDRFVFNAPGPGTTAITDFVHGEDLLEISAAGFGGGLVAGGSATVVTAADASAAVGGAGGYFIFLDSGPHAGTVYWDSTGGNGADATPIANLGTLASLADSDFHLI